MRFLALILILFLALMLILPRMNQEREPLFIDDGYGRSTHDGSPATWPRGAGAQHRVGRIPYLICDRVFRPLAPGQVEPLPETRT